GRRGADRIVEVIAPERRDRVAGLGGLEPRQDQRRQLELEGELDVRRPLVSVEGERARSPLEQVDQPVAALIANRAKDVERRQETERGERVAHAPAVPRANGARE